MPAQSGKNLLTVRVRGVLLVPLSSPDNVRGFLFADTKTCSQFDKFIKVRQIFHKICLTLHYITMLIYISYTN